MLKEESSSVLAVGNNNWARTCDTCRSAACAVYCRADSAYLCAGCDARIHGANQVASRHERVWVCEACERAPAAFICKADTASLCASCDADIHSANPLARRHHRVPVLPILGCLYGPSATDPGGSLADPTADPNDDGFLTQEPDQTIDEDDDQEEASSWLLLNPVKNTTNQNGNGFLFGGEVVDEYLHLEEYNSCQENPFTEQYNQQQQQYGIVPQKSFGGDRVVPVQCGETKGPLHHHHQHQNYQPGMMDYENPKTGYGYPFWRRKNKAQPHGKE